MTVAETEIKVERFFGASLADTYMQGVPEETHQRWCKHYSGKYEPPILAVNKAFDIDIGQRTSLSVGICVNKVNTDAPIDVPPYQIEVVTEFTDFAGYDTDTRAALHVLYAYSALEMFNTVQKVLTFVVALKNFRTE
jgi:hypothetical protein